MAIEITKAGDLYTAKVTPPHGNGSTWRTEEPLPQEDLIRALLSLGCHQTDIGDVLHQLEQGRQGRTR